MAAPLVAVSLGLSAVSDLAAHPGATLALLAAGFVAWGLGVGFLERRQVRGVGGGGGAFAAGLLLAALLVRLPLLFVPLSLSEDALRYLWDGRVAAAGANPYRLAPEAPELAPLRDGLWERLPHRSVPTVYPPLALGTFSIAASSPAPRLAWKALVAAADLATCALLVLLARRRGVVAARAAWYAWNPLVVLEVAGMGHLDALAVAPAVAAVLWLTPRRAGDGSAGRRPVAAAAAAAAGVLVKLGPLAALPLWARRSGRPLRFLAVAGGLTLAGLLPVVWATGGVPPGLVTYGVSWEFNGPLYEPLWRLLDGLGTDTGVARLLDAAKAATGWHDALNRIYPYVYPQLLAKLLLAALALAVVVRSVRPPRTGAAAGNGGAAPGGPKDDATAATRRLFGGLLLCSATVYPWYLLWVLPWAALDRHGPWLLASALAPLTYLAQYGPGGGAPWPLFPGLWLAAWGPPALLALVPPLGRRAVGSRPSGGPA